MDSSTTSSAIEPCGDDSVSTSPGDTLSDDCHSDFGAGSVAYDANGTLALNVGGGTGSRGATACPVDIATLVIDGDGANCGRAVTAMRFRLQGFLEQ